MLNDGAHGRDCLSVAIPSRMAGERPDKRPLEGWRVAVKDAFDLQGLRTSNCNRAYLRLYPPAKVTAPPVQTLIEQGASVPGKTKLSSFLSREEPSESVDFQTAWSPRCDGYQGPGEAAVEAPLRLQHIHG